jgi:hypothetical protein
MIMAAKTGRRMQTSASFCTAVPSGPGRRDAGGSRLHRHRLTGGQVARLDDHRVPGPEPREDLDPIPRPAAGLDADLDGLVLLHGEDLLDAGERHDGGRGHRDHADVAHHHDVGLGERPRAQHGPLVGHLRLDEQRAALLADGRRDAGDAAPVLAGHALDRHGHELALAHAARIALGHGQPEPERVEFDDGGDRRPRGQVLADRRPALADRPVDGRRDDRVGELLAGQL